MLNFQQDDDDHQQQLNSKTIKEFPPDTGTLVPERDNADGTMIAHGDYGTLIADSGTMVELESNLGTMVINSDSEDSTMKSETLQRVSEKERNANLTFHHFRARHKSG